MGAWKVQQVYRMWKKTMTLDRREEFVAMRQKIRISHGTKREKDVAFRREQEDLRHKYRWVANEVRATKTEWENDNWRPLTDVSPEQLQGLAQALLQESE